MRFSLEALKQLSQSWAPRIGRAPAIGLYFGKSAVNLVQMAQTDQGARIRAMASLPLAGGREALVAQPKEVRALLQSAFKAYPFSGKRVVSSLSNKDVKISTMSFRRQPGQSDDEALVAALRERMPDELDDTVVDFMSLRPAESEAEQGEALVALAPRQKVTEYLDLLSAIGLEAVALDVGPNALARLVRHSGAQHWREFPKLPNALLINVGLNASFLSVIWGRRLILDRQVGFAENSLVDRLQKVLEMPEVLAQHVLHGLESAESAASGSRQTVIEVLRPDMAVLLQEINKTL
ncbi:MAG: pilus assembly protein PilM, partial [Azonexus sp.]|nr:pilus assembly protein PilM [Azonexus sp.]